MHKLTCPLLLDKGCLGIRVDLSVVCDGLKELFLFFLLHEGIGEIFCKLHSPLHTILENRESLQDRLHGGETLLACPRLRIPFKKPVSRM